MRFRRPMFRGRDCHATGVPNTAGGEPFERVAPHVDATKRYANNGAELRPQWFDVTNPMQILATDESRQAFSYSTNSSLARPALSAALRCSAASMPLPTALCTSDARHVDKARRTADQRATPRTSGAAPTDIRLGNGARTISKPLAAFEQCADCGMKP